MDFNTALDLMVEKSQKIKMRSWRGYWYWDAEAKTIMMVNPGEAIIPFQNTSSLYFHLKEMQSDKWDIATPKNCEALGGSLHYDFSAALDALISGEHLRREVWPNDGAFIFMNNTGKALGPMLCFKNHLGKIQAWSPSQEDIFAKDWCAASESSEDLPKFVLIENCIISVTTPVQETGDALTPEVTITHNGLPLIPEEDYILSYTNNVHEGVGYVTITGIGDFQGSKKLPFVIEAKKKDISEASCSIENTRFLYTGNFIEPDVTVIYGCHNLIKDTDFTVIYENNKEAGMASAIVTGVNGYVGTQRVAFEIYKEQEPQPAEKTSLSTENVSIQSSMDYTGEALTPSITVTVGDKVLVESQDYTVSLKDNINVGTATATITGIGNYEGTVEKTFEIVEPVPEKTSLDSATALYADKVEYTGSPLQPEIIVTVNTKELVKDTDFTVTYEDNTNVGTGRIIITGIGDYTGTKVFEFEITAPKVMLTFNSGNIKKAPLHDVSGTLTDEELCTSYNLVVSPEQLTVEEGAQGQVDLALTLTDLKKHTNGQNTEGFWAGIALPEEFMLEGYTVEYTGGFGAFEVEGEYTWKPITAEYFEADTNVASEGKWCTFYREVGQAKENNDIAYFALRYTKEEKSTIVVLKYDYTNTTIVQE